MQAKKPQKSLWVQMIIKIKEFLIIYITKLVFVICCGTCKWTILGEKNLDNAIKHKRGVLISGWHGRFVFYHLRFSRLIYTIVQEACGLI